MRLRQLVPDLSVSGRRLAHALLVVGVAALFAFGTHVAHAQSPAGAGVPSPAANLEVAADSPIGGGGAMGNLHRVAATLDAALDVYRLTLQELVPVAAKLVDLSRDPAASPETPVPPNLREVFVRLSRSVPMRVPGELLPAISRAYHAEVVDALGKLEVAATLGEVLRPYQSLARAVRRFSQAGDDVVDLFARQRPIQIHVVDPSTVLDEIAEALDEVAAAERDIRVQRPEGSTVIRLQPFLRLEVALGHALDLIAAAEEAGIKVGFEVQLSTKGFADVVGRVSSQVQELERILAIAATPLRRAHAWLGATMTAPGATSAAQVELTWPGLAGRRVAASVRLYRDEPSSTGDGTTSVRLVDLPPGRSSYLDALPVLPVRPPTYRLVGVTALGVESEAVHARAAWVPPALVGVESVAATFTPVDARAPSFYRDYDRVEVRWTRSASDLVGDGPSANLARERGTPFVVRYDVIRQTEDGGETVLREAAGTDRLVDHVELEQLARGIRYVVVAVGSDGTRATPSPSTELVRAAVQGELELARAGLASLPYPTSIETRRLAEIGEGAARDRAIAECLASGPCTKAELRARWWQGVPEAQRIAWLREWPSYVPEDERPAWVTTALEHVVARDWEWLLPELWLLDQAVEVRAEVERWWLLLDTATQTRAIEGWRAHLNAEHREWLTTRTSAEKENDVARAAVRPARVLAWWRSRDAREQQLVQLWWQQLEGERRAALYEKWAKEQPLMVKKALRFADYDQRTSDERARLLERAHEDLPRGVLPRLMAGVAWLEATHEPAARLEAVRAEVGFLERACLALRHGLRPIDRALGFQLPAVTLVGLALVAAVVLAIKARAVASRG